VPNSRSDTEAFHTELRAWFLRYWLAMRPLSACSAPPCHAAPPFQRRFVYLRQARIIGTKATRTSVKIFKAMVRPSFYVILISSLQTSMAVRFVPECLKDV
jgi:hypothetical protein